MTRLRGAPPLLIAFGFFLLFLFVPRVVGLVTEWFWFAEIGFETVFRTRFLARLGLFLGAAAAAFAFLYANLRLAQRGVVPNPVVIPIGNGSSHLNLTASLRRLGLPVSLFLAFILALGARESWLVLLRWIHAGSFGVSDPVFGRDVGFYVFTLPGIAALLGLVFGMVVLALLMVAALYWLRRDIIVARGQVRVEPSAEIHLGALLTLFFVLTAVRLWFVRIPELLYSGTGPLVGASYTDLHATLPGLRLSVAAALIVAGVTLYGALRRRLFPWGAYAIGGYIVFALVARVAYPAAIQQLIVEPTELTREAPQLRNHIVATRRAWGLEGVETRDLTGEAALTAADIAGNASTIENVRLWDREPLLQTFGQLQEIRTYYDFVSVDDDRYWIDGKYRQVLLSPRELNSASLPTRTFINEHLTFTHGMGVTLAPVNEVTEEGLPVLFIKDLPPESNVSLRVTRPQIYYGELTDDYVIVDTRQREFDYPAGDQNIFSPYAGRGGVATGGLLRRLLFAARFGSSKILLSGDLTETSRILFHRDIMERAETALPFLLFDSDPYLVVSEDGSLQWILDAYTTSAAYPYAQRLADGTSYMRNSVKVTIDAYHGDVRAYVSDPSDPIIRAYDRIFPGILRPLAQMPEDLRSHLRYPEDLYRVQTALYTIYHMDEPAAFYNREDQWQIPVLEEGDSRAPFMRRIIMRLPEEENAEFIFMTPFTPRGKDNLAAWMVARNDGESYGKLRVYSFPKQSLIFGPKQVVARINQNTEISRQISLWDQRGSEVIRGELLVIPIEESLLYVQPLYLRAEGGRIPELKRVILGYQNQVVMEETLDQALGVLFGGADGSGATAAEAAAAEPASEPAEPAPGPSAPSAPVPPLAAEARAAYEEALAAQRAGDWSTYGQRIRRLGELLQQMAAPR
ncbi:UPF0182 family protein [soil metagenome]